MKLIFLLLLIPILTSCGSFDPAFVPPNWAFPAYHTHPTSDLSDIDQTQPEYL